MFVKALVTTSVLASSRNRPRERSTMRVLANSFHVLSFSVSLLEDPSSVDGRSPGRSMWMLLGPIGQLALIEVNYRLTLLAAGSQRRTYTFKTRAPRFRDHLTTSLMSGVITVIPQCPSWTPSTRLQSAAWTTESTRLFTPARQSAGIEPFSMGSTAKRTEPDGTFAEYHTLCRRDSRRQYC